MLESSVEAYMRRQAEARGALFLKFVSPQNSGVPDRMLLHPALRRPTFVELKAPGKAPRSLQKAVHAELGRHGADVFVVDCQEAVDEFFRERPEISKPPKP